MKQHLSEDLRQRAINELAVHYGRHAPHVLQDILQYARAEYLRSEPVRRSREEIERQFPIPPDASEDRKKFQKTMIEDAVQREEERYQQQVQNLPRVIGQYFLKSKLSKELTDEVVQYLLSD